MTRDDLVLAVTTEIAALAAHEGTALGTGEDLDELSEAVVMLGQASRHNLKDLFSEANRVFHTAWTKRVGTPGYRKPMWMAIDRALSNLASEIVKMVGFTGPLITPGGR